jgi:hypothetical protein
MIWDGVAERVLPEGRNVQSEDHESEDKFNPNNDHEHPAHGCKRYGDLRRPTVCPYRLVMVEGKG